MNAHPAERAELATAARRRVLAWAASEGLRVSPAAADRLVVRLAGGQVEPAADGGTPPPGPPARVVALAAYRDRRPPAPQR